MTHLWERDHDYYGPDGMYHATGIQNQDYAHEFESWKDFLEEMGGDLGEGGSMGVGGMNLLYRWDWHDHRKDRAEWGDEEYPNDFTLALFWLLPRKGILMRAEVIVTPEDEEAVKAWLQPHWDYLRTLWEPLPS